MTELHQRAQILKQHLSGLPHSKIDFASSLIKQLERKGQLSEKQWFWVDKLADMAQGIPDFTQPEPEKITVGALTGLIAMFNKAAEKLKYPAIALQLPDGNEVRLSRAGKESKNSGYVYVKVPASVGYAGKVDPDGQYFPKDVKEPLKTELATLLKKMSRHPAETAAEYGKLTGRCCFCSLPLTDPKSTAVGYGKVCAHRYGLPWGGKNSSCN
ncbi:MAG: hypothetical protein KJZ83_00175 [Burkholderiaceae bacterium]|nr:hypothetical protein [Burkholderiaceae bacterium]